MRLHLLAALMLAAAPLSAQSLRSGEVMSTLAVHPLARINPVLGSDDRVHLAYELVVTNPSKIFITLDKVEASIRRARCWRACRAMPWPG